MVKDLQDLNVEERKLLNRTAREQMKLKLYRDIRYDLSICELEGWDKGEYIKELQDMLNEFKIK